MDSQRGDSPPAQERRRSSIGKYLQKFRIRFGRTSKTKTKTSRNSAAPITEPPSDKAAESLQSRILAPTPIIASTSRSPSPVTSQSPQPIVYEVGLDSTVPKVSTPNEATTIARRGPSTIRSNSNPPPSSSAPGRPTVAHLERCSLGHKPADIAIHSRLGAIEPVDKLERIRLHHYCHCCRSSIGLEGVYAKCEHKSCKKCIRFPEQRLKENAPRNTVIPRDWDKVALLAIEPSLDKSKRSSLPMIVTAERSSLPMAVKNKRSSLPMVITVTSVTPSEIMATAAGTFTLQRICHTCHNCQTPFVRLERMGQKSTHILCMKCLQDSPRAGLVYNKSTPAAGAEQGDVTRGTAPRAATGSRIPELPDQPQILERTYKSPRQRIKYTCERCNVLFGENNKTCLGCGHGRCESCGRIPPKRKQLSEPPDPAGVKSLEAHLAALEIVDEAPSTSVQLWVDAL